MGKGTIMSEIGDGQYNVQLNFHRENINEKISEIDSRISDLTAYIATLSDGDEKTAAELLLTSYEKKKSYLQDTMPDDLTVKSWCADKTTGLTGEVGTIEVPGERGEINIQPGYGGNAAYDIDRDGQLQPAIAGNPFNTLYNWCLFPAWQKWKPTYRYGTISNISGDTCTVTLDDAESSQQDLDINRSSVFNDVAIDYMGCNGAAFTDGDEVLVRFENQDPDSPKVIGFKEDPRTCWIEPWGATLCENHNWSTMTGGLCEAIPYQWIYDDVVSHQENNVNIVDSILEVDVTVNTKGNPSAVSSGQGGVSWDADDNPSNIPIVGEGNLKVKFNSITTTTTATNYYYSFVVIDITTDPYEREVLCFGHIESNPILPPPQLENAVDYHTVGSEVEVDLTSYLTAGNSIKEIEIYGYCHVEGAANVEAYAAFELDYIKFE